MNKHLEIMDTTLRDGEQTSGVSFSISEKLTLAQLLLQELNIDRIEIASAHVSEGESKAVKGITDWAKSNGYINRIEILTFVDNGRSINWMKKAGAKVQNLLTKGSLNHLKYQLKQTPENHFKNILKCIEIAKNEGLNTNVYLEDWSNGMADSRNYVYNYLDFISKQKLPVHVGITGPLKLSNLIKFANIVGAKNSLNFIKSNATKAFDLLKPSDPNDLITKVKNNLIEKVKKTLHLNQKRH